MIDENVFTLRQADQARTDFAIIEADLEAIRARLARLPMRAEVARTALMSVIGGAGFVILFELFWRHCLRGPPKTRPPYSPEFRRQMVDWFALDVI